jgi:hypothetical protein
MNDMLQLASIPHAILPPENKTYCTTDEWYVALAEMHMAQLIFQHNDLVTTEDDCRMSMLHDSSFVSQRKIIDSRSSDLLMIAGQPSLKAGLLNFPGTK